MTLTISLPPETETKLQERARAAGLDLPSYAAQIIECSLRAPRTLEEISGPVYQRFLDSGVSDEQLGEELEQAKHEMRRARRDAGASS
jgi:hypothetical protein